MAACCSIILFVFYIFMNILEGKLWSYLMIPNKYGHASKMISIIIGYLDFISIFIHNIVLWSPLHYGNYCTYCAIVVLKNIYILSCKLVSKCRHEKGNETCGWAM